MRGTLIDTPDTPDPLAGLTPSAAPPELKAGVLAATRAALLEPPLPVDLFSRVWENRSLRLAWAASVLLLLGGHALVSRSPAAPPVTPPPAAVARSVRSAEAELAAIGRLPRLDLDARPQRVEALPPALPDVPPAHAPEKETRS